ncbi:hypothetical protein Z043_103690 [Scleropages formosus]|uniref:Uncharacterized protein n=1 Tax=Scleropages formosus TaxID=113540 RepID=A0A0P7UR49_SCLFO|nr:hypothetical protein Z043_103690 [Scleropages formosus]
MHRDIDTPSAERDDLSERRNLNDATEQTEKQRQREANRLLSHMFPTHCGSRCGPQIWGSEQMWSQSRNAFSHSGNNKERNKTITAMFLIPDPLKYGARGERSPLVARTSARIARRPWARAWCTGIRQSRRSRAQERRKRSSSSGLRRHGCRGKGWGSSSCLQEDDTYQSMHTITGTAAASQTTSVTPLSVVPGVGGLEVAEVGMHSPDGIAADQLDQVHLRYAALQLPDHLPEIPQEQVVEPALVATQRQVPGEHIVPVAVVKH